MSTQATGRDAPAAPVTGRRGAFFDLDETLITVSSIFRFLRFHLAEQGRPAAEYTEAERALRASAAAGVPRAEINRAYFRLFAGAAADDVTGCAERWFAEEVRRPEFFHARVVAALRAHVRAGDVTVLVSGSMPACVEPVARFVRADTVLCSRPEIVDGRYTGEVRPMIGAAKAEAVTELAAARGIDLHSSYAYGDHLSDVPVLALVGNPVAVGADPELGRHAVAQGWARWGAHP